VHKKNVVACVLTPEGKEIRTFSTMTDDLMNLVDWIKASKCTHVAMESTGSFWKPIYNLLELEDLHPMVVNASHMKSVPGRKTDVKDAEWIANLLKHGLLQASYIPNREQRELRELIRYRSGRAMIEAMIEGNEDVEALSELALRRMKSKKDELKRALNGKLGAHQKMMLETQLRHIDFLDQEIGRLNDEVRTRLHPFEEDLERLDTIPGVGRNTAEQILAEAGTDIETQFGSAARLCSWAGLSPGNNESAGKRHSGKTRKGNKKLRSALIEAARAAARTKNTYLSSQYHRIAARRGKNRAAVAVAHTILTIAYHILTKKQ
jgi:transposase